MLIISWLLADTRADLQGLGITNVSVLSGNYMSGGAKIHANIPVLFKRKKFLTREVNRGEFVLW